MNRSRTFIKTEKRHFEILGSTGVVAQAITKPLLPHMKHWRHGQCVGPFSNDTVIKLDGSWRVEEMHGFVSTGELKAAIGEEYYNFLVSI